MTNHERAEDFANLSADLVRVRAAIRFLRDMSPDHPTVVKAILSLERVDRYILKLIDAHMDAAYQADQKTG
jgi:hypothetical protein